MTNEEHLAILKQGVNVWNEWRKKNPEVIPNIGEVNLSNQNLSGINFDGAKLLGTNLNRTNLHNACFHKASLFGTSCVQANLQNSYFENADLKLVNFSESDITEALLVNCDLLEVNMSNAILFQAGLSNSSFISCNFYRANLRSTVLDNANLSKSSFEKADLFQTSLIGTTALKTNFQKAILTGTCIQDWNINSQTNLTDVICNHVYFKHTVEQEDEYNYVLFTERRPHDSSKSFAPGEFLSLVQKSLETVDLVFSNGIDWQAFLYSYRKLQIECGGDELAIQAIERKSGNSFVVRVEVPPDANKAEIEKFFKHKYELELKAKEEQYKELLQAKDKDITYFRQQNTDLMEIIKLQANKPIYISQVQGNSMTGDRNIHMGSGNYNERIKGDYVQGNKYMGGEKQTLAEAAAEIQALLTQLEEKYPTETTANQMVVAAKAVEQIESNPTLKKKAISAVKKGGIAAFEKAIDNPAGAFIAGAIKGWQEVK